MRLWSLHPKYLDPAGLVALWREGLLAQKVLEGDTIGYRNHPQLLRFKKRKDPLATIGLYLDYIWCEANERGYNFDRSKIKKLPNRKRKIKVTSGQVVFEVKHLKAKLQQRRPSLVKELKKSDKIVLHPIFIEVEGEIEGWEVL